MRGYDDLVGSAPMTNWAQNQTCGERKIPDGGVRTRALTSWQLRRTAYTQISSVIYDAIKNQDWEIERTGEVVNTPDYLVCALLPPELHTYLLCVDSGPSS